MRASIFGTTAALLALIAVLHAGVVRADDPCTDAKWDLTKERALFAGHGGPSGVGKDTRSAPSLGTERLYELTLVSQTDVTFVAAPGKKNPVAGAYAGLATLTLPAPGNYRVAVDLPVWLDVIADGKPAPTRDFLGRHSCDAPHKVVEFDLSGGARFVLQVSGAASPTLRVTVTRAPAATG